MQNKQLLFAITYTKKAKALNSIPRSVFLNAHPCKVRKAEQPQLPPGSKTAAAHQRGQLWPCQKLITFLSPSLNRTCTDAKYPNHSQSCKKAQAFNLGRFFCQPKRGQACMERTKTQRMWLQILHAAEENEDGQIHWMGLLRSRGLLKTAIPALQFPVPNYTRSPGTRHCTSFPFLVPATSFNEF